MKVYELKRYFRVKDRKETRAFSASGGCRAMHYVYRPILFSVSTHLPAFRSKEDNVTSLCGSFFFFFFSVSSEVYTRATHGSSLRYSDDAFVTSLLIVTKTTYES